MGVMLKAENVAIRYITGDFKDIGLKEYTMRRLTGNYQVKEFMAVDGVSFELNEGDMLGIVGSNGAGKSTLLKAVAGIMEPTRGKITANGDIAALLELGSGFDGDLTVKENAYLRGAMLGYTKEFMDSTYEQIIDFAELKEFENRPFKQLSSGMKSRLAFSIASLVKPDILILDEVLSVGDGAFQEKSAKKMREIISQGATTILVSHSLEQIRELCNKVLWLDHGRQVAFGDSAEICDRYEAFLRGECLADMPDSEEERQETIAVANDDLPIIEVADEKRKLLSGKRIIVSLVLALFCAVLAFNLGQQYFVSQQVSRVEIRAQEGSGEVTFRGAAVDGQWVSSSAHLIDDGGWAYDVEQAVYTAVDGNSFIFNLPAGEERTLTFNVGPDAGIALVDIDGEHFEFNLWNENVVELGQLYKVPALDIDNAVLPSIMLAILVFAVIFCLIDALVFWYEHINITQIEWNRIEKIWILILLPLTICILYFFSVSSSPKVPEIANYWGEDGSFYTLCGKICAEGGIPYVDIFEQKGPIIFLIYTVGYILSPVWGLFVIQCGFLWIAFVFSYFIAKEMVGVLKGILASLVTMAFYVIVMDEGALTEDFNLPFLMFSTYLTMRYLLSNNKIIDHPIKYAFVYGVACGISLGLRFTNCVAICGFILPICFMLLINKQYKNILQNMVSFLSGFMMIALPFVIYFAANGALYDLAWGTLLYNMYYAGAAASLGHSLQEWLKIIIYLLPIIICCILALEQKRHIGFTVFISAFFTAFLLSKLFFFQHYYIIVLTFVPIAFSWILHDDNWKKIHLGRYKIAYSFLLTAIVAVLAMGTYNAAVNHNSWMNSLCNIDEESFYVITIKNQIDMIPDEDKDYVIGYNVRPDWYLISNITPCYKYYTNQDWGMKMSKKTEQENIDFYRSLTAKWIVVQGDIKQQEILQIIEDNYHLYDSVYLEDRSAYLNLYATNDAE